VPKAKAGRLYKIEVRKGWVRGEWVVRLVIDHQSFDLDSCNCTSKRKAAWVKRQLKKAVDRLIGKAEAGK